jgi:hypothetical protein
MLRRVFTSISASTRLPAVPLASTTRADTGFGPIRFFVRRDVSGFEAEAEASVAKELAYYAAIGREGPLPPANFLAISGGGDKGAFAAGLLNGWTEAGTRPHFKAVTGISTGALIAPFAFLGPAYDHVLVKTYTQVSRPDIFRPRGMLKGLMSDAMADSTPLYKGLVSRFVDQPLLDAIAAEYAKGRLLLVGTTLFDSIEPVVWNMTALAASGKPGALELFRRILVASTSIPGAFPPMLLDVTVDGTLHHEMHVDGAAIAQVFVYPPSLNLNKEGPAAGRERHLYIIRNSRPDPDWTTVKRKTLSMMARAVASAVQTQGIRDLHRIFWLAQRDGVDYNLAYIPPTFSAPQKGQFDQGFMQALFETARSMARGGYPWSKCPPDPDGE